MESDQIVAQETGVALKNAAFFFWAGLAWYFKPVAGFLTDSFPMFGSRRKSYLVISSLLAVLSWIGLYFTPHQYNKLLWTCIMITVFMVVASTVVGAYMVEIAQAISGSGRLTALRQFVQQSRWSRSVLPDRFGPRPG